MLLSSLIGNAAAGYRLAGNAGRRLLPVLLPLLAAALVTLTALDLLVGRFSGAGVVIVNGVFELPEPGWWRLGVTAAFWLVALPAAALVTVGCLRGYAVRPSRAVRTALRNLPVFAIGVVTLTAGTGLALLAFAGLGPVAVLAVLLAAGVVAARLAVGLLAHQLHGSDWGLTRGRVTATAGAFLLGGVVVPAAVLVAVQSVLAGRLDGPWAAPVAGAAGSVVVVAVQAGILGHVYLLPRDTLVPAGAESVDPAAVDARLRELSGPSSRVLPWAGAAATVLALLAPAAIAWVNPFGAPTVRWHGDVSSLTSVVAWPAGRHPTIATWTGVRFCDNDLCDRYVSRNGGPAVPDGKGATGISADGTTVVKAAVAGGPAAGGPFINYARCTRDGCPQAWVPLRRSAKEPVTWPELGAAVAPDQALWFVLATEEGRTYRITFVRCPEIGCKEPQRYDAGSIERLLEAGDVPAVSRIRLTIAADGRPAATIRTGTAAFQVTCAPVTCARPSSTDVFAGDFGSTWTPAAGGQVVSVHDHVLRAGATVLDLPGGELAPRSGAVVVSGSRFYVTAAEVAVPPGLRVTAGDDPAESWRQVLWRCDSTRCDRQPLDRFGFFGEKEAMAVSEDGRVLIVRQDRVLLVTELVV